MLYFLNDYSEGAHPKVMEHLMQTNMEQLGAYGSDCYSDRAKEKIKKACRSEDAEIHFLTGGTQTNLVVISSLLHSYEGVVAVASGHIGGHEAGAIEGVGHKVLTLPDVDGKLQADALRQMLESFYQDENHTHMVFPGMVYISHPTEYGTLYSKEELNNLYNVCREYDLPLFVDGARLGYALATSESDVALSDLCRLCDVFYIGGTKVGALCGEAVVFTHKNTPTHFMTHVKQKGALLAKGRLNGVQFDALFTDDLYMEISRNAIALANQIKDVLHEKGYEFYLDSPTNQIFIVLNRLQLQRLEKDVAFTLWEWLDSERAVVRLVTSWATTSEQVKQLQALL